MPEELPTTEWANMVYATTIGIREREEAAAMPLPDSPREHVPTASAARRLQRGSYSVDDALGQAAHSPTGACESSRETWRTHQHGHHTDLPPDRFELFLLGDGEQKCTIEADTRVANCVTFHFAKEDHTLGNLLRAQLLQNPKVSFAGYRVPHPLFPNFDLRVQTNGECTPQEAVLKASHDLIKDLTTLRNNFTREWELRRMVDSGAAGSSAV